MKGELNTQVKGRVAVERRRDSKSRQMEGLLKSEGNRSLVKENGERVRDG